MGVDPNSVDLRIQRPSAGLDESDLEVSRQFTYLVRCVRNVRIMNDVYGRVRKKENWGADPEFVRLNPSFTDWLNELPRDLHLDYPLDGSPPWLPTHFIGNLHTYYHLSIIMLHRPQLMFSGSFPADGGWKQHMLLCYSSAKYLCRLQEAVLQTFGLPGLLCMQRGINFTIYAVLTCAMLHLVSLSDRHSLHIAEPDYRLLLLPLIQTSTQMQKITSPAICASLSDARLRGPCQRCKLRLMLSVKRSRLTSVSHSSSGTHFHTVALEDHFNQAHRLRWTTTHSH